MPATLYGLKNCDTCRKAMHWLQVQGIEVRLHDLRNDGLEHNMLDRWLREFGWEALLNRRSTSWRQLDPAAREPLDDVLARKLMLQCPALVKRPVLELNGQYILGFSEARYATYLAGAD